MTTLINNNHHNDHDIRSINNKNIKGHELLQGNFLKNKKKKLKRNYNLIEGFDSSNLEYLALEKKANSTYNSSKMSDDSINTINSLYDEINNELTDYSNTATDFVNYSKIYGEVTNPNNKWLGQTVRFTTGHICYVTKGGIVRYIPSENAWNDSGVSKDYINIGIPYLSEYWTEGTLIESNPPLISGGSPNMVGSSKLGNSRQNVYVNEEIQNTNVTGVGPYANNSDGTFVMKFPNGEPPINLILNGKFDQPQINDNSFEYISSTTKVPYWTFNNGVIINNSSAWNYPMPYPKGNQGLCIQGGSSVSQNIKFTENGTFTLSFYACGRSGYETNPLACVLLNTSTGAEIVYNVTPTIGEWIKFTHDYSISETGNYVFFIQGKPTNGGDSCTAIQDIYLGLSGGGSGLSDWGECKNQAIYNGYKYFGLQDANSSTGKGFCGVSNDEPSLKKNGNAYVYTLDKVLWQSNTTNGDSIKLSNVGSLQIMDSNGTVVYSTKAPSNSSYWGCYGDSSTRAIPNFITNSATSMDDVMNTANDNNATLFGIQWKHGGVPNLQGFWGTDIDQAREYGKANNCSQLNNVTVGGGWSNAVYGTQPGFDSFLVLQDDGNMVIYRGQNSQDNQGVIWATGTNGKQGLSTSKYASQNSSIGGDSIKTNGTMKQGEWISNNEGSIVLMLETNGNLVLYSVGKTLNQIKLPDGNYGSGAGGTYVYELSETVKPSNMGKIGYIGKDNKLHEYTENNIGYTNTYTKLEGVNQAGAGSQSYIPNSTVDDCKKTCNESESCYGFVFDEYNNCYPKGESMQPMGTQYASGFDLYTKNKIPVNGGVNSKPINISTTEWDEYQKGSTYEGFNNLEGFTTNQGDLSFANFIKSHKDDLDNKEKKITELANKLSLYGEKFDIQNEKVQKTIKSDAITLEEYLNDLKCTDKQLLDMSATTDKTIKRIVDETEIKVSQRTSFYLLLSIISVILIIIILNVAKK